MWTINIFLIQTTWAFFPAIKIGAKLAIVLVAPYTFPHRNLLLVDLSLFLWRWIITVIAVVEVDASQRVFENSTPMFP